MSAILLLLLVCTLAYIGIRIILAMLETSIWLCAFVLVLGAFAAVAGFGSSGHSTKAKVHAHE